MRLAAWHHQMQYALHISHGQRLLLLSQNIEEIFYMLSKQLLYDKYCDLHISLFDNHIYFSQNPTQKATGKLINP